MARAIVQQKTRVIDIDLRSYFDNIRHDRLLAKVARRVDDADVMHLLKLTLKANGRRGVPQGGVLSPLLSNVYLTEVDRMLERAKETTRCGKYTYIEYARFADDRVPRTHLRKEVRCCARDGGRSSGAGRQGQAPNHRKLRRSRAVVVSVAEKAELDSVRYGSERRA